MRSAVILVVAACLVVLADSNAKEKESVYKSCTKDSNIVSLQRRLSESNSIAGSQRLIHKIKEVNKVCNNLAEKHVSL